LCDLIAGPAEAAFAAGKVIDGILQRNLVEVRPQRIREIELRIGHLP
jgi:hypothetical protein